MGDSDLRTSSASAGPVDVSGEVDARLGPALALPFQDGLVSLLALEKRARQAEDTASTRRVLVAIAEFCRDHNQWEALNENLVQLSKRRGLLKAAMKAMVKTAVSFLDSAPALQPQRQDTPGGGDRDRNSERESEGERRRDKLVETLLEITDGKIYVEKARARLVLRRARELEGLGRVDEAARLLQEVPVETFGAMRKEEKTAYILEQMRMTLARRDYVRTQIISRKIHPKILADEAEPFQQLKVTFNELMIRFHTHGRDHLSIARCYHAISQTPIVRADQEKLNRALSQTALHLVLSERAPEQQDLLMRFEAAPEIRRSVPLSTRLAALFLRQEVVALADVRSDFAPALASLPEMADGDEAARIWEELSARVIEHNLIVVSTYYKRLGLARLASLLSVSEAEAERHLSRLVVRGLVQAAIDRPARTVAFKSATPSSAADDASSDSPSTASPSASSTSPLLVSWREAVGGVLTRVETAVHLVHREHMVHASH